MNAVSNKQTYDEEILIEQLLIYSEQQLNEYCIKLFSVGITKSDLNELIKLESDIRITIDSLIDKVNVYQSQLKNLEYFLPHYNRDSSFEYEAIRYDKLKIEEYKMLTVISELEDMDERILNIFYESKQYLDSAKFFKDEAVDYIVNNTSLLHLIYSNNTYPKIKRYSINSHMFLCQFHTETKPSFGVTSQKNLSHCFGCGFSGNQITYIMNYENYSFIETIYFLAEIYLIEIPNNPFRGDKNVEKYRKVLLSDDYINFINSSIKRVEKEKCNEEKDSLIWYKKHIKAIERIKSGQLDETIKNNYKNGEKVYKKQLPNFNN